MSQSIPYRSPGETETERLTHDIADAIKSEVGSDEVAHILAEYAVKAVVDAGWAPCPIQTHPQIHEALRTLSNSH
jgi:hypothetical protein